MTREPATVLGLDERGAMKHDRAPESQGERWLCLAKSENGADQRRGAICPRLALQLCTAPEESRPRSRNCRRLVMRTSAYWRRYAEGLRFGSERFKAVIGGLDLHYTALRVLQSSSGSAVAPLAPAAEGRNLHREDPRHCCEVGWRRGLWDLRVWPTVLKRRSIGRADRRFRRLQSPWSEWPGDQ